ncbi:MAG: peptide-methionine (R)-S-oxide reductase MsrB [Sphingobacteriales bacterium]
MDKVNKTDQEYQKELTPEQYQIARKGGTEAPFNNEYWDVKDHGIYECRSCGNPLFSSETKFDSGTGWPSFYDLMDNSHIELKTDNTLGDSRTEVICAKCGAHLGHLFNDAPQTPTGLRYCMNSASLKLDKEEEKK